LKDKYLIVHGGGPTPVINSSLFGVIKEALKYENIDGVYAAIGGTQGYLDERFARLDTLSSDKLNMLLNTPGTSIGTSRTPLYEKEYNKMVEIAKKHGFTKIIFNGGNGTMDTCGKLHMAGKDSLQVVGIPKTIDNDLAVIDHSPGYGSAARYIAGTVGEIAQDLKGMPIHVSIVETMGRNTGWIAAASSLGREFGYSPDLIYLPEVTFNQDEFLEDVERLFKEKGGVLVVASEGLINTNGEPITKPIFKTERATYFGDVGTHLAQLVIKELGIKARSEKPGIAGRASIKWISKVDRDEAIMLGEYAVEILQKNISGVMVGLDRVSSSPYEVAKKYVPIKDVMMHEKTMPDTFINEKGNNVTDAFIEYARPLIGEALPEYISLI
jgi:6-phosphofructokinase 1